MNDADWPKAEEPAREPEPRKTVCRASPRGLRRPGRHFEVGCRHQQQRRCRASQQTLHEIAPAGRDAGEQGPPTLARCRLGDGAAPAGAGERVPLDLLAPAASPLPRFVGSLHRAPVLASVQPHARASLARDVSLPARHGGPRPQSGLVRRFRGTTPRVLAKALTERLRGGATLAFNGVDELHEPLTRVAESFEAVFESGTHMNAYAGWRSVRGLDVHCDDQDIFILQIDGRKRWQLFGSTLAGIDAHGTDLLAMAADAAFDEILESGISCTSRKGATTWRFRWTSRRCTSPSA